MKNIQYNKYNNIRSSTEFTIGTYCPVGLSNLENPVHPFNSRQGDISTKQCH